MPRFAKHDYPKNRYALRRGKRFIYLPNSIECPERKDRVSFLECLSCQRFQVWHESDEDFKRCWYEYKDLKSRGYYDGTWDDHPDNFDPETFAQIQEQKRLNAEVNRELESEFAEHESKAKELAEDPSYYYGDFWKFEEGDEDQDEDDDEEDYF